MELPWLILYVNGQHLLELRTELKLLVLNLFIKGDYITSIHMKRSATAILFHGLFLIAIQNVFKFKNPSACTVIGFNS